MNKLFIILPVSLLCAGAPVATFASLSPKAEINQTPTEMHEFLRTIRSFQNGVKMVGTVTQGRAVAVSFDPISGEFIYGQPESQNYGVQVYFQNKERVGTGLIHTGNMGPLETVIDEMVVFADEEGYAYSEYLDHTNSIQRRYKLEDGNKLSYAGAGLYNIFDILDEDDYTYNDKYFRYDVDLDKTSIIVKNLLAHQNVGFSAVPEKSYMKFANNKIQSFDVVMEPINRVEDDMPVQYSNKVSFKFSEAGTCMLPQVTKYPAKPENQRLNSALKTIGDNFELTLTSNISVNDAEPAASYRNFKFNGSEIYVHKYDKLSDADVRLDTDFVLKAVDNSDMLFALTYDENTEDFTNKGVVPGFAQSFQGIYYYEDLLPKANEVSTDFFTYNEDTNEYVCRNADVLSEINPLFYISRSPFIDSNIDNASQIGIRVKNDGSIDYVKYYVNYMDPFNGSKNVGTITINYTKIGSTTF